MPKIKPGSPAAWLLAARPKTLFAALAPVLTGTALALAHGRFHLPAALTALACALLLQIGVNIANDYFDHLKGVDGAERLGPTRAAASGLLPLRQMKRAIILLCGVILLAGSYLVYRGGWPILLLGLSAVISMIGYSAGPFPLASHALGDLFVFLYFGFAAVGGTYFVQARQLPPAVWLAALPMACLITAILVVNNLRDRETDRKSGKITLAVLLGATGTRLEYLLLLAAAYTVPVIFFYLRAGWWSLLPLATLPAAVFLVHAVFTRRGRSLNPLLGKTSLLSFIYALLFSAGILLGRVS